jgi:uncharacterized protein YgfB (UPF0149 family)
MNYVQLTELFRIEHLDETAADVHGILCGRIAGGQRLEGAGFKQAMMESLGCEEEIVDNLLEPLHELYRNSLDRFGDGLLAFQPLLPADDAELSARVSALGEWCRGFISGLGDAGLSNETPISDEVAGTLEDIMAITHAGFDHDVAEDDEKDFMELTEYVRVAVIMIHAELSGSGHHQVLH